MAATTQTGICALCGPTTAELTIEHVFPRSWYPDEFMQPEMLRVPTCLPCNRGSGRNEDRVFADLVSTLPNDPRIASLHARAGRATDPAAGRDERDARHRRGRGEALLRRVRIVPPTAVLPDALWSRTGPQAGHLGETEDGTPVHGFAILHLPHEHVELVIVKFLRCCYFDVYGEPLPREPAPWMRSFTPALQETRDRFLAQDGVVTRGAFPFEFAILRAGRYVSAWFALWDQLLYVASNCPVPER